MMRYENDFSTYFERAVEMDRLYKIPEAICGYRNCIAELSRLFADLERRPILKYEEERKQIYKIKINELNTRVLHLQDLLRESYKRKQRHIEIKEGDCNKSYKTLLSEYLDCTVTKILINDPYIRTKSQVSNLLKFIELVVLKCYNLEIITLVTTADPEGCDYQEKQFCGINNNLMKSGAEFKYNFSSTLHDRSIMIDNGWMIKIGRGLDYFYPCADYLAPGYFDLDLRYCRETTIDIFYNPTNVIQ